MYYLGQPQLILSRVITVDIENKVRAHVEGHFLRSSGGTSLSNDESLLESGILDSAGIFERVVFLEKEFDVTINDEDIVVDNFENIACITKFVQSKTG
jgi:acyl carrier protein